MAVRTINIFVVLFLASYVHAETPTICSVPTPTASQVCVTIKFPWEKSPVSFCTDRSNIDYVPECAGFGESQHCFDDGRNDTLKIATPWTCCPIISTPNRCSDVQCPPAPFNRNCKTIKKLGECCPTYFCDEGEPESCKTSRMNPSCTTPPADKVNCTAFRDPYGCCNKYMCAGEEKQGMCPRHIRGNIFEHHHHHHPGMLGGSVGHIVHGAKVAVNKMTHNFKNTLESQGGHLGARLSRHIHVPFNAPQGQSLVRCTGDDTCPGSMKCCSPSSFVHPHHPHQKFAHNHFVNLENNNVNVDATIANTPSSGDQSQPGHHHHHHGHHHHHHHHHHHVLDGFCFEPHHDVTSTPVPVVPKDGPAQTDVVSQNAV